MRTRWLQSVRYPQEIGEKCTRDGFNPCATLKKSERNAHAMASIRAQPPRIRREMHTRWLQSVRHPQEFGEKCTRDGFNPCATLKKSERNAHAMASIRAQPPRIRREMHTRWLQSVRHPQEIGEKCTRDGFNPCATPKNSERNAHAMASIRAPPPRIWREMHTRWLQSVRYPQEFGEKCTRDGFNSCATPKNSERNAHAMASIRAPPP